MMGEKQNETKWYLLEKNSPTGALSLPGRERSITKPVSWYGYVYLIVDCSGSMEGDKIAQARKGAINFAKDALTKGYLTGLIQFHESATHICEPQKDISILEKHIKKIEIGSTTNMADAVQLGHRRLKNKRDNKVMIIITDGLPDDASLTLKARNVAVKDRVDIIAIGTDDADQDFLKKLASRTELGIKVEKVHLEHSIAGLSSLLPAVIETEDKKKYH